MNRIRQEHAMISNESSTQQLMATREMGLVLLTRVLWLVAGAAVVALSIMVAAARG